MNAALWAVQILLAVAFVAVGGMKVFAYEKYKAMSEKQHGPTNLSHGLVTLIGISEIAGGVGIVLPMATNIAPWLSPLAAAGLATVMLLAVVYHLRRREPAITPAALLLLALLVAVGRFSHWA
jgi:uncharacterized membrane protein YphA (DoxX/SURF4 family)